MKRSRATPQRRRMSGEREEGGGILLARTLQQSTHAPRIPALPQDVIDIVLSFIADDRTTLRHCSFVSRAWARSAATHLFARRRWPKCEHHWSNRRRVAHCTCASDPGAGASLSRFLQGAPRVRTAVRELRLRFVRVQTGRMPMGCADLDALLGVLALLPGLRVLVLAGLHGHSAPARDRASGRAARRLERLVVTDALHLDQHALAGVVAFFGAVDTVVVHNAAVSLPEDLPITLAVGAAPTVVGMLAFQACTAASTDKYLDALASIIDMPALARLFLYRPQDTTHDASLPRFLDQALQLEWFSYWVLPPPQADAADRLRSAAEPLLRCSARAVSLTLVVPRSIYSDDARQLIRGLDWDPLEHAAATSQRLEDIFLGVCNAPDAPSTDLAGEDTLSAFEGRLSPKVFKMLKPSTASRGNLYALISISSEYC